MQTKWRILFLKQRSLFPMSPHLMLNETRQSALSKRRIFCQHREPYAVFQGSIIGALQQEKKDYPNHYWWVWSAVLLTATTKTTTQWWTAGIVQPKTVRRPLLLSTAATSRPPPPPSSSIRAIAPTPLAHCPPLRPLTTTWCISCSASRTKVVCLQHRLPRLARNRSSTSIRHRCHRHRHLSAQRSATSSLRRSMLRPRAIMKFCCSRSRAGLPKSSAEVQPVRKSVRTTSTRVVPFWPQPLRILSLKRWNLHLRPRLVKGGTTNRRSPPAKKAWILLCPTAMLLTNCATFSSQVKILHHSAHPPGKNSAPEGTTAFSCEPNSKKCVFKNLLTNLLHCNHALEHITIFYNHLIFMFVILRKTLTKQQLFATIIN